MVQVNKKEIEEEKEKEEENVDSKAKGEEEDEENLEISEIFKIDETKEEVKDITRKEINDEKDKSINNVKQREHLNDENYENEIKMLEREIESNEEEEKEELEEEGEELEEKEEKEEVLSGKNNLTKLLKNANENEISEDTYENEYMQNERYNELMLLMANDFVPNFEPFECPICLVPYKSLEGLVLKDCLHTFCKTCLANTVLFSDDADVKCPYKDENYSCEGTIQQSEIKAIVKLEDFNKYLQRSIVQAESKAGNSAYHCKTPDCPGWCIYEPYVESFICPVCEKKNCLLCKMIHKVNCTEDMLLAESSDSKSEMLIQKMLRNKNALPCPTCNTIIMKIDGCDAVVCTICKTEICWLTRGPRWGPKGQGDTSGGCKCNVNIKCHPNCRNCH
ncbi:ranBP-type and C3HC4-type zinc finger-containing protein 1-like isoform X2 [Vespa mandarinia]|nr:ranBP-type and C3HC4-type zinc finger-containing protein 1-like isoform X2 [Vespa mandarinia]